MAPIERATTKSDLKVKTGQIVEEDDKWTDLAAEKEDEKDAPTQTESPQSKPQPRPQINCLPIGQGPPTIGPPPMAQPCFPPGYDAFGRPLPTEQTLLENQLIHTAEVTLGVLNAATILESHLLTPPGIQNPDSNSIEVSVMPNMLAELSIGPSPSRHYSRSNFYSSERLNYAQMLRDMGYLLGLRRAIRILQDAAADQTRVDYKYTMKVVPPPPSPQAPQMHPMAPMSMGFPPTAMTAERELRTIAKDLVKDTVREYRDAVVMPGMEDVQKEMIKLCRDVCRDALNNKGDN
jgi:hypothetical protein